MAQVIEKRFGGEDFVFEPWSTRQVYKYLPKLAKLFTPVSALLVEVYMGGEKLTEVVPGCISYLAEHLDDDGFENLFKILFEGVSKNGVGKLDLDDVSPEIALEIAIFVIKERFSPFMKGGLLTNLLQEGMKVANLNETVTSPEMK